MEISLQTQGMYMHGVMRACWGGHCAMHLPDVQASTSLLTWSCAEHKHMLGG